MRRMNYNPFEKPFASGKCDDTGEYFLLDKNLEAGIYFLDIYFSNDNTSISAVLKIDDSAIPSCTAQLSSGGYIGNQSFILSFNEDPLNKVFIYSTTEQFLLGSTIKVYKIA